MPFKKKSGGSRGGGRPNTMGIGAQGSGLDYEKFAEYQERHLLSPGDRLHLPRLEATVIWSK